MSTLTARPTWASLRAHRGSLAGTAVVLAVAGALVSATGVLMESGLRDPGSEAQAGLLSTIASSFAGTALLVVLLVLSSTVTLALRQRRRELALLRVVGATSSQVRRQVSDELVLLTLVTAPVGAAAGLVLARLTRPLLLDAGVVAPGFAFTASPLPALSAVVLLLPVAVVAARLATRETLRQPPTAALREAAVDQREIGRVRRVLAAVTAAAGLLAAGSPLVVPGTIGAATAATSALLLVAAAALAGPLLVGWVLRHVARLTAGWHSPAGRLAVANSRGFSRRLATAVVPLAVALAIGTVQSTVDRTVSTAGAEQLRDGLHADLVVTSPAGFTPEDVAQIGGLAGVGATVPLASTSAQVRVDDEDVPGLAALSWEAQSLRVLPAGGPGDSYDPDVVDGSLTALDRPDTVAVSTDVRFETGHGLGDEVEIRLDGRGTTTMEVVAVYDRGLGFGGYTTGTATVDAPVDTVLVDTDAVAAVTTALTDRGLVAAPPAAYARAAVAAGPQEQRLSLVLLLALLVFVGLAAANTLVMTTSGRRGELTVLARTGATRRQLVAMATFESLLVAGIAWAVGTLAVLPAITGVSVGLLGAAVPPVALATYGVLSLAVLAVSVGSIVGTAAVQVRR